MVLSRIFISNGQETTSWSTHCSRNTYERWGGILCRPRKPSWCPTIASKISGVIPCGTTGESPTLSSEEHLQVIRSTIKSVNGQIPVIAGTGANSTEEALELTKNSDKAGADAFLL